jgi:hypothetical protein
VKIKTEDHLRHSWHDVGTRPGRRLPLSSPFSLLLGGPIRVRGTITRPGSGVPERIGE